MCAFLFLLELGNSGRACAVDGTITVTFDKAAIAGQSMTATDFTVTTNSAVTTTVVPALVTFTTGSAVFTVAPVVATTTAQMVTYNVAYAHGCLPLNI